MKNVQGFGSDSEYLDTAAKWLRARAVRVSAERELADAIEQFETGDEAPRRGQSTQQLRCKVVTLKEAEDTLRRELDERLDAHRQGDYATLGIDVVSERDRLTPEESFVLLAAVLSCLSNTLAERIYGDLFTCYSGLQVSDAVRLLGATVPSEWVRYRKLFLPESPLVKNRHLRYDRVPQGPEGLMDVTVSVGRETFALITGTDLEPESYDDEELE